MPFLKERRGFGYGALAAGADLIVAEALIALGAELHVLLPGGVDSFRAQSVGPFGEAWRRRFDATLRRADTVRAIPSIDAPLSAVGVRLANEVALGAALMNARRLATEALQLLVIDSAGPAPVDADGATQAGVVWEGNGLRQLVVTAPREPIAISGFVDSGEEPLLATVLTIALPSLQLSDGAAAAAIGEALQRLRQAIPQGHQPVVEPQLSRDRVIVACGSPADAAALVERLRAAWPEDAVPRMGADGRGLWNLPCG